MKVTILAILLIRLLTQAVWAAAPLPVVEVYKSPTCGCCGKWVDHLKANGFRVVTHDTDDVMMHKYRLGVPPGLGSCHTAEVGGYVVEGHVPAVEIKRLLKEHPSAKGLVVPAMPMGSPGMEGDHKDSYDVLLINRDGSTHTYAHY
jgi:hypothetical protein